VSKIVVALSGPVAAGKSTLAARLRDRYDAHVVGSHDLLERSALLRMGQPLGERRALQEYGAKLDDESAGAWLADQVEQVVATLQDRTVVVVDAVRTQDQVDALRARFGRRVVHVHVHAPLEELAVRYPLKAGGPITELPSYEEVRANPTESKVADLAHSADVSIDTKRNTPADVEVRAAARLGLLPSPGEPLVDVLVGGQYGSEGKGNIAFYLAPEYDVLVRVGGPNAGHKVPTVPVTTHRSLPSGTLANPTARLIIGPGAVLNVATLLAEIDQCPGAAERLSIDPQAMLINDEDVAVEQARLVDAIGSTGQGVGQATARRISGRDGLVEMAQHATDLAPYIRPTHQVLDDAYGRGQRVMLEGTQGTSLSLFHGPYPHVTSRDTTVSGCLAEAGISPRRVRRAVVVCRTYPIRVGGESGPISQEIDWDTVIDRAGAEQNIKEVEVGSVTNRTRRVGEFDWLQLRRAAELNGATDIALTFADYHRPGNRDAYRFEQLNPDTIRFIEEIESVSGSPVSLIATRFAARSVIDRREWRGHVLDR
jgi:adenylosuccinate synthase